MKQRWQRAMGALRSEALALYFACRHPGVPWYAKALATCVVAYAFSPIDLIPDPIPVLGYLDDLILVPLGISVVRRLIPAEVMAECRAQAAELADRWRPRFWSAAVVIVAIWVVVLVLAVRAIIHLVRWKLQQN